MPKTALPLVACLLAFSLAGAHAQPLWKWRDASGQMHISDTAPPPGTPAKNIISGPPGGVAVPSSLAPVSAASAPASPPASAPVTALDKQKKAADQEKADKEKADRAEVEAKNAAVRKDNCARAQTTLTTLQSGQRVATVDSKGERQIMDDDARAAEIKHTQQAVSANCGPAPAAQ